MFDRYIGFTGFIGCYNKAVDDEEIVLGRHFVSINSPTRFMEWTKVEVAMDELEPAA